MPNQDFFAQIALGHHPVGKDELFEPHPPVYEKRTFLPSTLRVEPVEELSYEKQIHKFNRDLQTLREQYQSFMVDHTPTKQIERKLWELNDLQFRFETPTDREFERVLGGHGDWEKVNIPHYGGPRENGPASTAKYLLSPANRMRPNEFSCAFWV